MTRHKIVESKETQSLVKGSKNEIDISESYSEYQTKLDDLPLQFSSMWNGLLGQISIVEYKIELITKSKFIYSVPY